MPSVFDVAGDLLNEIRALRTDLAALVAATSRRGRQLTFVDKVSLAANKHHDSQTAQDVDGFREINLWVLATHPNRKAMEHVQVELVFQLPQMGATGFASLGGAPSPNARGVVPVALRADSGPAIGGFATFVGRAPIIGPSVRVIIVNPGPETYEFSVFAYLTR